MVNWIAVRPPTQQIAPAYCEPVGLVTVDSTSSSFTSISKIVISLGVRPLDPILGLRPWTTLGDFCPPGYLPLCVNPSPQSYRAVNATDGCMDFYRRERRLGLLWLVTPHGAYTVHLLCHTVRIDLQPASRIMQNTVAYTASAPVGRFWCGLGFLGGMEWAFQPYVKFWNLSSDVVATVCVQIRTFLLKISESCPDILSATLRPFIMNPE